MAKVQTNCPRCKSPVVSEVEQIFDLNTDPQAKQKLLSGQFNTVNCPTCGYNGAVSTLTVYHDPDKELLLTYVPPELGLPLNEQEKALGPLINKVVNNLPLEKRKAYLFRPQAMLTFQTMLEKVLEADGITKEMLDAQQKRLNLIQRLISTATPETRSEVIVQEKDLIDENFFAIFGRIAEAAIAQNDEKVGKLLVEIQQELLTQTEAGKKIQEQSKSVNEVVKDIQALGKGGLTRESLLELFVKYIDDELKITTLTGLARGGLDYQFFQLLSGRVDAASVEMKPKLEGLREKLLEFVAELDKQAQAHISNQKKLLDTILASPDPENVFKQSFEMIDDVFLQLLEQEQQAARSNADLDRLAKIGKLKKIVEEATKTPPEVEFLEELLKIEDDKELEAKLNEKADLITPELTQLLGNLATQTEGQPEDMKEKISKIYKLVLKISMSKSLKS